MCSQHRASGLEQNKAHLKGNEYEIARSSCATWLSKSAGPLTCAMASIATNGNLLGQCLSDEPSGLRSSAELKLRKCENGLPQTKQRN